MINSEKSLIGQSVQRTDIIDKVTGCAVFVDDIPFGPNLLHSRLVRSPHPHALIKSINTKKAEQQPGVRAARSSGDFDTFNIINMNR